MLELAQEYELIFYDQRECGASLGESLNSQYINIDQFSQDIESLRSQLGYEKMNLLGHSWGAMLAMNYVIKYPQNVTSLILLNSAPVSESGEQAFREVLAARIKSIQEKMSTFFDEQAVQQLNAEQINQLYRDLFSIYFYESNKVEELSLKMSHKAALNGFRVRPLLLDSSSKVRQNLSISLRALKVPTLIIHGDHDIVPPNTAQEIKETISESKIIYLKNCDHFPYIEAPEMLFSSIKSFLSELPQ